MDSFLRVAVADSSYSVVIDDSGRAAYAYLLDGDEVVGDVWLWNRAEPQADEWADPARLPFANLTEFIDPNVRPPSSAEQMSVAHRWEPDGTIAVELLDGQRVIARLWVGAQPGQSVGAMSASSVALPLS